MTDEQIIFRWMRSTKDMQAVKELAELSCRKQTEIIHLLARAGYMKKGWNNAKGKAEKVTRWGYCQVP